MTLFKTLVLSTLLYGCKTLKLTKGEEKILDTLQNKCLRRILRIRWQQHVTNERVLELAETERVRDEVRRRRWTWIGHALRKHPTSDCAVALGWRPEGRRRKDGQKQHGVELLKRKEMERGGLQWERARQAAKDRKQWKEMSRPYAHLLARRGLS